MASSPKYLKKKKLENKDSEGSNQEAIEEDARVNLFIDSRKGQGKKQAGELWYFLWSKETELDWEWIPLAAIEKHMKESCSIPQNRLFQLLKEMEENHLIKKKIVIDSKLKTPNKERTYYKFHYMALNPVRTKEGYEKGYRKLYSENSELRRKIDSAMIVLNKHHLLQDYYQDYFGERPRPDDPTNYSDLTKSVISFMGPKVQKGVQRLIDKGCAKDELDVIKRSLENLKKILDEDLKARLDGPIIIRK